MIPAAGEVWSADRGDEQRRLVVVVSDVRLHRLAGRAIVVPVLTEMPEVAGPWHVSIDDVRIAAGHLLASVAVDRLHERVDTVPYSVVARLRRVVALITQ